MRAVPVRLVVNLLSTTPSSEGRIDVKVAVRY